MRNNSSVLFVFPYDWLTSPRSTKEVNFLSRQGYNPTIIWTKHRYVTSGKNISASPQFDGLIGKLPVYQVPFFVAPLDKAANTILIKLCVLLFYIISTLVYSIHLFFLMFMICKTKKIKLIHVHNTPDLEGFITCIVSKIIKTPYVFEIHDHTPELYSETMGLEKNSLALRLLKIMEMVVVSNSSGNIFTSETSKRYMESEHTLDSSDSIVIYSGPYRNFMFSNKYNENEKILEKNSIHSKFKVLYLGSLTGGIRRGLDILVESMGVLIHTYKLSDIVLIFVGDGSGMIKYLSKLAADLKIINLVFFTGRLCRSEAYKWLTVADVVVDPLKGYPSTLPLVTNKDLVYMAAKKIIVASDLPGHKEIYKNQYNALLFSDGNPNDLANKMYYLYKNFMETNIQNMKINAERDFIEKYCWEKQEPKLVILYRKLIQ